MGRQEHAIKTTVLSRPTDIQRLKLRHVTSCCNLLQPRIHLLHNAIVDRRYSTLGPGGPVPGGQVPNFGTTHGIQTAGIFTHYIPACTPGQRTWHHDVLQERPDKNATQDARYFRCFKWKGQKVTREAILSQTPRSVGRDIPLYMHPTPRSRQLYNCGCTQRHGHRLSSCVSRMTTAQLVHCVNGIQCHEYQYNLQMVCCRAGLTGSWSRHYVTCNVGWD